MSAILFPFYAEPFIGFLLGGWGIVNRWKISSEVSAEISANKSQREENNVIKEMLLD